VQREPAKERNFLYGVLNGIFITGGDAFLHTSLVIAPFLALLGAPAVLIGLLPALRVGGYFLPQLLVANRLAGQPYKLPWYNLTSGMRIGSLIIMTATAYFFGASQPGLTVAVLLLTITVNTVGSGIAGVPFADVTAKIVPHSRLGTFWVLRNSIGGVLALACGWALSAILSSDLAFPHNFGLVFLLGTILSTAAYLVFSLVKEPPGELGMQRPLLRLIREIPALLRLDANLRRFLRVRFLGLAALLAEPFYAIYAIETLGAPESALGIYIIFATSAAIISNFALRRPADTGHNVAVLQVGFALTLIAPLIALLAGSWQLFALVFILTTVANQAINIAAFNLLYAIAPAGDRPLYIGLSNTVLALPSLAPVLAGALLPLIGARTLFAIALALGLATLAFTFRFNDLRDADRRALTAVAGGDEQPPSPEVAEIAEAVLTPAREDAELEDGDARQAP
jgi:hypothetical protein